MLIKTNLFFEVKVKVLIGVNVEIKFMLMFLDAN